LPVTRDAELVDPQSSVRNRCRSSSGMRISLLIGQLSGTKADAASESVRQSNPKNRVAAFIAAITDHVLPLFLVIVGLQSGPRLTGRENNRLRVAGPGEGMDLVFSRGNGKSLATISR